MKRALFVLGATLVLAGAAFLGYGLYAGKLTDQVTHVIAGMMAVGAIVAALVTDPKGILAILDRVVAWKRGGSA